MPGSITCPRCGVAFVATYDDLEGESFGDECISQTYVSACPGCGMKLRITDTFCYRDTEVEEVVE